MANLLGAKGGRAGEDGAKVSNKGDGMGGTVLKADCNGDESLGRTGSLCTAFSLLFTAEIW